MTQPPAGTKALFYPALETFEHADVPRWQEGVGWQACIIQGRMSKDT